MRDSAAPIALVLLFAAFAAGCPAAEPPPPVAAADDAGTAAPVPLPEPAGAPAAPGPPGGAGGAGAPEAAPAPRPAAPAPPRTCAAACAEFNTKLRGCFGENYPEIVRGCQRACADYPALAKPCLACFPAHECDEIGHDACDAICLDFRMKYVPIRPNLPAQVEPFIKGLGGWCGAGPCPVKK